MKITVAICTWNRAPLLERTLVEMRRLVIPEGVEWEVVVVNNNCSDDTDVVLARHGDALPLVRLLETKQGHSHARNCAVGAARGELLIWTDDDVLVDPNWVAEYVKAATQFPTASYFGGAIDPWFETEPQGWIADNLMGLDGPFALRPLDPAVPAHVSDSKPVGANMAFRVDVLGKYRFRTELGRIGEELISGDERELVERLRRDHHIGVTVPAAKVRHFVPASRMRAEYIWPWYVGSGRSQYRSDRFRDGTKLWGVPRWIWLAYVREALTAQCLSVVRRRRWFEASRNSSILRGVISESRK